MARTEYRDLLIPLNIRVTNKEYERSGMSINQCAALKADPIIIKHLEEVEREGWQPEDKTSFIALANLGKVQSKAKRGINNGLKYQEFVAVTIRLSRVVD